MAVIKPVLTITSNASTAATGTEGPASIALALSAKPTGGTSTVTDVHTQIYTTTTAHVSVYTHTDDQKVWVYMKNLETTAGTSQDIYVGDANADMTAGAGEDNRLLTIRAAENVIRILPPLNVKKNELDLALKIINKVCSEFS